MTTGNQLPPTFIDFELGRACPSEDLSLTKGDKYGYFPAALNQVLHRRYTIIRKLGWGTAASVWLAEDTQLKRHVALKIMTAFWTEEEPTHELSTLTRIRDANPSHPGRRHCPSLIDHFRVKSHHGDHAVLVTPVSGPSLHSVRLNRPGIKPNPLNLHPLPITLVKKWLREMLLALDYLHTHVRIIHSDFRLPNVLLDISDPTKVIPEALGKDPTKYYTSETTVHNPVRTFVSQPLPAPQTLFDSRFTAPSITLIDFSGANWIDNHKWRTCQNEHLRAPEVILGHPWGPPADIWAFACMAVELWSGWPLFGDPPPYADDDIQGEDFDLQQMIVYAGEQFNSNFLLQCQNRDNFFDAKGNLKRAVPKNPTTIIKTLRSPTLQLPEDEHAPAADFLRRCLRLDPRDRESAAELLQHHWLSR